MMNNFRLGDRVRIVDDTEKYIKKGTVVKTGESSFKEPTCLVSIDGCDIKIWFTEKYLQKERTQE